MYTHQNRAQRFEEGFRHVLYSMHSFPLCFRCGAIKNLHCYAVKQIARFQEGLVLRKTRDEITPGEGWEGSRNSSPSTSVSFPPECIRQGLSVFQQIQENETAAAI